MPSTYRLPSPSRSGSSSMNACCCCRVPSYAARRRRVPGGTQTPTCWLSPLATTLPSHGPPHWGKAVCREFFTREPRTGSNLLLARDERVAAAPLAWGARRRCRCMRLVWGGGRLMAARPRIWPRCGWYSQLPAPPPPSSPLLEAEVYPEMPARWSPYGGRECARRDPGCPPRRGGWCRTCKSSVAVTSRLDARE